MSVNNNIFTPEIFNSEFRFRQFFQSEEEIQEIARLSRIQRPYQKTLYYDKWQVVWIVCTTPFRMVLSLFWKALACFYEKKELYASMQHAQVKAAHQERLYRNYAKQAEFKEDLLCPASNFHQLEAEDLYKQPSLPTSSIRDPWVLDQTYARIRDRVDFFDAGGLCAGASRWFVHLYLSTKGMFESPYEHMRAVGKQFEKGMPKKAALLHALNHNSTNELFPIKTDFEFAKISWEQIDDPKAAIAVFNGLEPGCYELGTFAHRFVYIKSNDDLGFIFDPNKGVIVQEGDLAQKVFNFTLRYLQRSRGNALVIDRSVSTNPIRNASPLSTQTHATA